MNPGIAKPQVSRVSVTQPVLRYFSGAEPKATVLSLPRPQAAEVRFVVCLFQFYILFHLIGYIRMPLLLVCVQPYQFVIQGSYSVWNTWKSMESTFLFFQGHK